MTDANLGAAGGPAGFDPHPGGASMDNSWSARAACHGLDPRIFFPADDDEVSLAKAVCDSCPVREPCLEYALGEREREGVWGGCTEGERRRIVRRRRRAAS